MSTKSHMARAPLHLAALLMLAPACGHSGTARGVLAEPGQAPEPVTFDWESGRTARKGSIEVTMPNGDHYAGGFYESKEEIDVSEFDPLRPSTGPDYETVYKAVANLMGREGKAMHCEFILERPEAGVRGGGIGACKTSDGRRIEDVVLKRR